MGLKLELSLTECASEIAAFDTWVTNALISMSPFADVILFSGQTPEQLVFVAKIKKMDPTNQCCVKKLEIPLDECEQITSVLCIPIFSTKQTSFGSVDWTVLVVGLSSGYVKFYTEQSICLLSLKFCDEPVISLKLQTQKTNLNSRSQAHFASMVDELMVIYKNYAVVCDGLGLNENLRISRQDAAKRQPYHESAYTATNLPTILTCQRWKFQNQYDTKILDADLFGMRSSSRFDIMKSESINSDHISAKTCTRTLVLVGSDPFISCYQEARDTTTHSYTEMLGSLLPFWSKPEPTRVLINDINLSSAPNMFDKGRVATNIVSSPDKRLAVITDDYGRVMLLDVTNWLIVRIWKGYRNAQCGWVEVKRSVEERSPPYASFLVIYAPRRGLLEIWSAQRGPRVAAFNVGKNCRLLYSGFRMLNMRAESLAKAKLPNLSVEQSYSANCFLVDFKNRNIFSIEIPYTYSLYKYGDLQSRDRLLMNELVAFIQQGSEISVITDTLERVTLAESQEQAIQKIASQLLPNKIDPIMKGLLSNIMRKYDDQCGETMSRDDQSIVELCKRLIKLCTIFVDHSESNNPDNMSCPDADHWFVDKCEEHPKKTDELACDLGWTSSELLRYLSLLALGRSYNKKRSQSVWPNLGESLTWHEFIDCFDLSRQKFNSMKSGHGTDSVLIRLKDFKYKFLSQEKVLKTAIFMYSNSGECFYKAASESPSVITDYHDTPKYTGYNHLEPSSRLILLFQFWLSTDLCNYWKMWAFLKRHIGRISDELKVIAMSQDSDAILIEVWKRIYHLILESDNIYAAIIATAAVRGDTLRTIDDNDKREKLEKDETLDSDDQNNHRASVMDWECLCVDAERMSLLVQQLEDVFLLKLLLRYSLDHGHLVDNFVYRVPRISVANILRGGPTVVSELVAQWAVQANIPPKIFTEPYGLVKDESDQVMMSPATSQCRPFRFQISTDNANGVESAKELLHHAKTSFPRSLEANVVLMNCLWEFCNRWAKTVSATDKHQFLNKALDCLSMLDSGTILNLKHNASYLAYKTFFQRTFERLVLIIETNSTILSPKSLRSRETISRRELNMSEDCLLGFVQFCYNLSDLMLETFRPQNDPTEMSDEESKLKDQLVSLDDWWSTLSTVSMQKDPSGASMKEGSFMPAMQSISPNSLSAWTAMQQNSLMNTAISYSVPIDIETLVELNRLSVLMVIIFKLKLIKAYPLSLVGEKSRQVLKIDLQQSPSLATAIKSRLGQLKDLRQNFCRKCILSIVEKLTDESNDPISSEEAPPIDTHSDSASEDEDAGQNDNLKGSRDIRQKSREWIDRFIDSTQNIAIGESNESMVLFTQLLTLTHDWELDRDELHLEFVFEMYRCNHDALAAQLATRVIDKHTLATGLLKISSQRVLTLFGLSPGLSSQIQWQKRIDKWSSFQPNVASWLKNIQEEETRHELAALVFPDSLKPAKLVDTHHSHSDSCKEDETEDRSDDSFNLYIEDSLGLRLYVLKALKHRTKSILETITNYLEGQANRLAYDLLQLLESESFEMFLASEKERWLKDD